MKIKLKNSAKRVLANVFSAKVDDGNALIPENIRKDVKIFDVVGTYGTAPVTPEALVPFRVGQRIKGVTIDPNAKTNEEIANWLNTLSYVPNESTVLMAGKRAGDSNIVEVSENNGVKALIFFADAENFLVFSSADVPEMNVSKGWSKVVESVGTYIPITEKTTFDSNYEIMTIADGFDFLNGSVLGAVEAARDPLIPFRDGQRISGIVVDPTVKTDEEIAS